MKAILLIVMCLAVAEVTHSKRLRAVISFTYDESFEGAKLYGQELSQKAFEKLLIGKDFGVEPKIMDSAYSIFGLIDGRCNVKFECCKDCNKKCDVPKITNLIVPPTLLPRETLPTKTQARKSTEKPKITPAVEYPTPTAPPAKVSSITSRKKPTTEKPETKTPTPEVPRPPTPVVAEVKTSTTKLAATTTTPREVFIDATTPRRPARMVYNTSKAPFRGPPYIPQVEVTSERVDRTWRTYPQRDVTFRHQTYQPFTAGTWKPHKSISYAQVTAAPKYANPNFV